MRRLGQFLGQERTFHFNVGAKSYACPEPIARLVSKCAFRNSLCDGTVDCLDVPVRDDGDVFGLVLQDVEVPLDWADQSVDRGAVAAMAQAIGYDSLLRRVCDVEWPKSELSDESVLVLTRLEVKRSMGIPFEDEIEFLARNFLEVARHFRESGICLLEQLGVELCERVLEHPDFEDDEDGEILQMITARGEEYRPLLRFLRLDRVAGCDTRELADQLMNDGPGALWFAVSRRLACEVKGDCEPVETRVELFYHEMRSLNGIIAYLTRKCGGNVHKKGIVNVTASSGSQPEEAADLDSDSDFCSEDRKNSWICYDFRGRRVTPTSYSIRSHGSYTRSTSDLVAHPRSWVLEVSNTGREGSWQVVDRRENYKDLNDSHEIRNFGVPPSGDFRFVRLRLTGKTHQGNDCLHICALELFGVLSRA